MSIDWQAYLDKSLPEEEMLRAEEELKINASARKEFEGLLEFLRGVRAAGLTEQVPFARLEALVPSAPKAQPRRAPVWAGGLGLAASIVFGLIYFLNGSPTVPSASEFETSDPVQASLWASSKLKTKVPVIDLGSQIPLTYVHEGPDRCCFDYKVAGNTYHVNISNSVGGKRSEGRKVLLTSGNSAYVGKGVRWSQGGFDFVILGQDDQVSLKLAERTSEFIQRA